MPLLWFKMLPARLVWKQFSRHQKYTQVSADVPNKKTYLIFGSSCYDSIDIGGHLLELLKYSYPTIQSNFF